MTTSDLCLAVSTPAILNGHVHTETRTIKRREVELRDGVNHRKKGWIGETKRFIGYNHGSEVRHPRLRKVVRLEGS